MSKTKIVEKQWVHAKLSLAIDLTKYIHVLLPTDALDEGGTPPMHELLGTMLTDILVTDWIDHYRSSILRGCTLIYGDGFTSVLDLVAVVAGHCESTRNDEVVILANDDELMRWLTGTEGNVRNVTWHLADYSLPIKERYLLIEENMLTVEEDGDEA